jgi:hypothetical protein
MIDHSSIQQVLINHVLAGGSRNADHFGVQAYRSDRSVSGNGMPNVLLALQRLSGACHGGFDRGMAMQMRNEIKRTRRGLSDAGVDLELQGDLEKLKDLVDQNLISLETYIFQHEGSRYSRMY